MQTQQQALGELRELDERLDLTEHTRVDGSTCWRVLITVDGREHILRTQDTLVGLVDGVREQRAAAERDQTERPALEAEAASRGVPVYVLEHEREQAELERLYRETTGRVVDRYARRAETIRSWRPRVDAATGDGRASRRSGRREARPGRGGAAGRRSRTTAGDADPEPPAPAVAICDGCGATFRPSSPRQRYHDRRCQNAAGQRRWYDRHRAVAATRPKPQPNPQPSTCASSDALRRRVHVLSQLRLEILCELPAANGNRANLVDGLHLLDRLIYDEWGDVRRAEAVTR